MAEAFPEKLKDLIAGGENVTVEFKESKTAINKDVYETVCSFSNRYGGYIFLGVKDNGEIVGVDSDKIVKIKKEFTTSVNNENKMYPPLYLFPTEYETEGKHILRVNVPESPNVCMCGGRIYDRIGDSDIDVTRHSDEVFRLYARKSGSCYVNKVFPAFHTKDLRADLIERARTMSRSREKNHIWLSLSNDELVRSAGLILKDPDTEKEGLTLAAILLFGSDELIASVLPQHKTDAIYRVFNTDRYDDRDVITTNLIESYDRLMSFGQKHLNDTFHLDGIQSVNARDNILREIISNLLAHRDYSSQYVAKLVIERNRVYTENANLTHGHGALSLSTFQPFSKNPPIAKVFREIGLADELGSGMKNTYKYTKLYSGAEPEFIEADIFRITIPLSEDATATVVPPATASHIEENAEQNPIGEEGDKEELPLSEIEKNALLKIKNNPYATQKELGKMLNVTERTISRIIKKLKASGIIERVGSDRHGHWSTKL